LSLFSSSLAAPWPRLWGPFVLVDAILTPTREPSLISSQVQQGSGHLLGRYRQGLRSAILEVHDRYLLRRIAPRLIRTWSAVHEDAVAAMGIDERHDPMVPLHASDRTAPNR